MAVDVSSLGRMLNGYKEEQEHNKLHPSPKSPSAENGLITRDLLGSGGAGGSSSSSGSKLGSTELDLDLQVPSGWEKRLDLKSGKVYLTRPNPSCNQEEKQKQTTTTVADLNFPPAILALSEERLELKLFPTSCHNYQQSESVCTLDKVKSALERQGKESSLSAKKKSVSSDAAASPSRSSKEQGKRSSSFDSSSSSSSSSSLSMLFAGGCPSCLMYVLISKANPKCPRCDAIVPILNGANKKPRIDLNASLL